MASDVAEAGGAEHRIGHGVTHDIGVGVPDQTELERDRHAAEHQRTARAQPVQVVALPDPDGGCRGAHGAFGRAQIGRLS